MLTKVVVVVIAVIVMLAVFVATRPSEFRIARSIAIAAPAAAVFAQVNDFHNWEAWSPYAKLDPAMKKAYEGPSVGVGASYAWSGNNQVGEGRTTITESRPNELIKIDLLFIRPFAANNAVEFRLMPEGDQTKVTWSMTGRNGFMAKAVGVVMSMDKMVGGQFEQGLAQLKAVTEAAAP